MEKVVMSLEVNLIWTLVAKAFLVIVSGCKAEGKHEVCSIRGPREWS